MNPTQVKYVELHVLEDGHEAMHFETVDGEWLCVFLAPGLTFNANPEIGPAPEEATA
jgi:hypothetical protein